MKEWIAEQVEFQYLRNNVTFYMTNPLESDPLPHYTCESLPPETLVWTLYEPWRKTNPWVVKGYRVDKLPGNAAAGLINSVPSDYL